MAVMGMDMALNAILPYPDMSVGLGVGVGAGIDMDMAK